MSQVSTLSKVAVTVSIAAISAGVVYYLFRKEEQVAPVAAASPAAVSSEPIKVDAKKISAEQLLEIMGKIVDSQSSMKTVMKKVTEDIERENLSFAQVFDRVKDLQPNDPMEQTGLTMSEFDELLEKYQEDPRILDAIAKIMGPSEEDLANDDGKILTVKELVDIHQYMLEEIQRVTGEVKKSKTDKFTSDARTLTVTAQVLVGAKVEQKFKVASQAIERSVMMQQAQLASNHQFATINMMMQQAMGELMGDMMPGRE
jgi:hypothetical protein